MVCLSNVDEGDLWDIPVMADLSHRFSSKRTATAYHSNLRHSSTLNFFEEHVQRLSTRALKDDSSNAYSMVSFYERIRVLASALGLARISFVLMLRNYMDIDLILLLFNKATCKLNTMNYITQMVRSISLFYTFESLSFA